MRCAALAGNKAGLVGAMTLALQAAKDGGASKVSVTNWQLAALAAAVGATVGLVLGRAMR